MNPELQSQLLSIIPSLVEQIKATKDFALDQAPDVIHQLIIWNFTYSVISFSVSLFCFLLGISLIIIGIRKRSVNIQKAIQDYKNGEKWTRYNSGDTKPEFEDYIFTGGIVPAVLFAISTISFVISLFSMNITWLKIWIAPKVWLIEYASHLIK